MSDDAQPGSPRGSSASGFARRIEDSSRGSVLRHWLAFLLPLAASAAAIAVLANDEIPLGKLGEWVWNRSTAPPAPADWAIPLATLAGYVGFVIWGGKGLERGGDQGGGWRAWVLVPGLVLCAALLHATWTRMPREGLGQERWPASLYFPATSGYLSIARQIADSSEFLAGYADWVATQDNFHIGTHPPGLILLHKGLLELFERHPRVAAWVLGLVSPRFQEGLAAIAASSRPPLAEQATLAALALLTWAASLATTGLVYLVARTGASRSASWLAAAFWPLAFASVGFLPLSDCLYPPLALGIVWMMVVAPTGWRAPVAAAVAGLLFWFGMTMSLAFLAVAPIALGARFLTGDAGRELGAGPNSRPRALVLRAAALAFFLMFGVATVAAWCWLDLDLVTVWRVNLAKHSGFYRQMPRTYSFWTIANLVEFAIAAGPVPVTLAVLSCRGGGFRVPRNPLFVVTVSWLATVAILDLSGRNLSEVARLWVFLAPLAACASARALDFARPSAIRWASWLVAQGLVTLVAIARVEPLLPIRIMAQ